MKEANLDWESIATMFEENPPGEVVHIEDEAEHKTVDVWVE